jgi:hypothetical protein
MPKRLPIWRLLKQRNRNTIIYYSYFGGMDAADF